MPTVDEAREAITPAEHFRPAEPYEPRPREALFIALVAIITAELFLLASLYWPWGTP